jgi:hypothetical protein
MNLETALLEVSALNLWLAAPKVGHKVKTVWEGLYLRFEDFWGIFLSGQACLWFREI